MKKKGWSIIIGSALVLFVAALAIGNLVQAAPDFRPLQALLGTSFSYQGRLDDGGAPANGTYDLRFSLWDDSSAGSQVGSDVVKLGESVEDGLFTVDLDFGDLFDGTALWLEVEVKGPGDPDYTALSPRQSLTAVPYAHYALNIPDHDHWGESWIGTGDGLTMTSSDGSGVVGHSSLPGVGGVEGISDFVGTWMVPPIPAGVVGRVSDPDSNAAGIYGVAANYGIIGKSTGDYGYGVWGSSENGTGVFGFSIGGDGVRGLTSDEYGKGIYGRANSETGSTYGVYGITKSPDGVGGYFESESNAYGFGAALQTMNLPDSNYAIRSFTKTQTVPGEYDLDEIFSVDSGGNVKANMVEGVNERTGIQWGLKGIVSNAEQGRGVYAHSGSATGVTFGVYGVSSSPDGFGAFFANQGGGDLLSLNDATNTTELEFFVDNDGNVYADGTYSSPAADFAEILPAVEGLEAGDVLVIDLDGQLVRSTQAFQPTVVGVYSTKPGFLGGASDEDDLTGKVPLAVLGVVPVKASAENGSIQPGDMLVASDTPGYAMRAGENPSVGTILGKALEPLESGLGVIQILITLQ